MNHANDNTEGKVCTKCLEWKPLGDYHTMKRRSGNGRRHVAVCKTCHNALSRARYEENREEELLKRHLAYIANPAPAKLRSKLWGEENRERKVAHERERRKQPEAAKKHADYNKEHNARPDVRERRNASKRERRKNDPAVRAKMEEYRKEYYSRPEVIAAGKVKRKAIYSTDEWKANFNERRRERYATDPEFFCAVKCRGFVARTAKKAKTKKSENTVTSLGYTPHQLRLRMECQFKAGMSWDNHGEWHIDHKKPIAAFLAQGITDPKTINALCNLQPLWGDENQVKSSAWPLVAANDNTPLRKAA